MISYFVFHYYIFFIRKMLRNVTGVSIVVSTAGVVTKGFIGVGLLAVFVVSCPCTIVEIDPPSQCRSYDPSSYCGRAAPTQPRQ